MRRMIRYFCSYIEVDITLITAFSKKQFCLVCCNKQQKDDLVGNRKLDILILLHTLIHFHD